MAKHPEFHPASSVTRLNSLVKVGSSHSVLARHFNPPSSPLAAVTPSPAPQSVCFLLQTREPASSKMERERAGLKRIAELQQWSQRPHSLNLITYQMQPNKYLYKEAEDSSLIAQARGVLSE